MGRINTNEQLDAIYGTPLPTAIVKEIDHIDADYAAFVEKSPFVIVATVGRLSGLPFGLLPRRLPDLDLDAEEGHAAVKADFVLGDLVAALEQGGVAVGQVEDHRLALYATAFGFGNGGAQLGDGVALARGRRVAAQGRGCLVHAGRLSPPTPRDAGRVSGRTAVWRVAGRALSGAWRLLARNGR